MLLIGMFLGLMAGAVAGALFEPGAWLYGAAIGALAGGLLQLQRRLDGELADLRARLDAVQELAQAALARRSAEATPPALQADGLRAAPAARSATDVEAPAQDFAEAPFAPPVSPRDPVPVPAVEPAASKAALGATAYLPAPPLAPPSPHPLVKWLLGGNTVVRAGVVILFFGVAFLLKFAYEHSHLPVEARLVGVSVAAIVLLVLGWRLRHARPGYALTLQGGAVALLSLTIFAAFRLYGVLPAAPAFALLVLIAAFSAALAVLQDSLALAVLGVSGGFLAPVLASTGHGSHVMLFSYYGVLNLGIVAIAWKKAWRALNLAGFGFTFVIGLLWGSRYYQPEFFPSVEPFLVFFFLLYLALPLLFARLQRDRFAIAVDATLVFGVPAAAFSLQSALVRDIPQGMAWSALALGIVYLGLATALWRRAGEQRRLLTEAFLALGGGFATLCIPLAFDGRVTSALWAMEGAAVAWIGLRQNRPWPRAVGYLLQIAAGIAFAFDAGRSAATTTSGALPFLNAHFLGCALVALAAGFCSAAICRADPVRTPLRRGERFVARVLLAWGALWWAGGGLDEIDRHLAGAEAVHASLAYLVASAGVLCWLAQALRWPLARYAAYAVLPVMAVTLLADTGRSGHPLADWGVLAWPMAFVVNMAVLRRVDGQDPPIARVLHPAGVWLFAVLLAWEAHWQVAHAVAGAPAWAVSAAGLVPAALLVLLGTPALQGRWPVAAHPRSYRVATAVLAAGVLAWTWWADVACDGAATPLAYVPLLNPLDIATGLALLVVLHVLRSAAGTGGTALATAARGAALPVLAASAFVAANAALLRAVHHVAGVPFTLPELWSSVIVQAVLALSWSLLALVLMALAARRALRPVWLAGAALMGAVVIKLFLVDLSNVGGVERIVSFIGVGALMLVIGYIAPVPPRRATAPSDVAGDSPS